jgi:hypothetical protein
VTGLGFEPAWLMIKRTDNAQNWRIYDNTRDTTNPRNILLFPDDSGAEATSSTYDVDFDADGFTLDGTNAASNASGGTYIYMAFADTREAAFWKDVSGNNNNWTPNNLDYRDSVPDSPTNNFAVMSSIHPSSSNFTISDGNLSIAKSGTGIFGLYSQSLMPTTGKWYFEACITGRGSSDRTRVGVANYNSVTGTSTIQDSYSGVEISTAATDKIFIVENGSTTENDTFYTALSDNDVVRFAVDMDNGRLYIGVNSNWWDYNTAETGGDPTSGSGYVTNSTTIFDGSPMTAYSGFSAGTTTSTGQTFNFGQDSTFSGAKPIGAYADDNGKGLFQYAPPTGFLSLCSDNLPEVTVGPNSAAKPIDQFETILYTGNGGTQHIGSGGVQHPIDVTTIDNSLRFNDGDSAYLARTPASAGNRKTWTWSGWVKRGNFGTVQTLFARNDASVAAYIIWNSNNKLEFAAASAGIEAQLITTPVYKDASAFYHIVMAFDTTQATASDRIKFYINGVQITSLDTASYPSQNYDGYVNTTQPHYLGSGAFSGTLSNYFDGYLSDVYFIDGQALDPTSFGQYGSNGYWIPKAVTGLTYGTNGFSLDFSDNSTATALGTDSSGNGNDWTPSNLGVSDQMLDSPTQNYAVMNPLDNIGTSNFSEGNLKVGSSTGSVTQKTRSTFAVSQNFYFEAYRVDGGTQNFNVGVATATADIGSTGNTGVYTKNYSGGTGDILMFAYSASANALWTGLNGTWDNSATVAEIEAGTTTNATHTGIANEPIAAVYIDQATSYSGRIIANFGQDGTFAGAITAGGNTDANGEGNFTYAPPAGYLALNANNILEERGINSPDLVWIKQRSGTAYHNVYDSLRIVGSDHKRLYTNATNAEESSTYSGTTNLISFDYDGFTVGNGTDTNNSGSTYASWNWKAGGTAVANTDGSITSQVSANTDAGFSIVSYTGTGSAATVGHGLGVVPSLVIWKKRDGTTNWSTQSTLWADQKELVLNSNGALSATDSRLSTQSNWTSTTLDLGTYGDQNGSGGTYIAYCFADVEGFSKAGSYTGNGSADGPFVYTGFRPAWVMFKRTDVSGDSWYIIDSTRNPYNEADNNLYPNSSEAEYGGTGDDGYDFLSNGFKVSNTYPGNNGSGGTIIYLAFAENPFKYANAR